MEADWELPQPDEPPEPLFPIDEPTGYGPGSPEKIKLMGDRFDAKMPLYHPDDASTCQTLPESVGGKTYVSGHMPGLSLRTHDGTQDWFVSTWVLGVQVVKRFAITEHEVAVDYLQRVKMGGQDFVLYQLKLKDGKGCREVVEWFKYHVGPKKCVVKTGAPIRPQIRVDELFARPHVD